MVTTPAAGPGPRLLDKNPSWRRIVGRVAKYHVACSVLYSGIVEILDDPAELSPVCWGRVPDYLLLYQETLERISRSVNLDHVIGTPRNSPCPLQVLKLVSGLKWRGAALMELLDHPSGLVEVLVDDPFSATPEFLADPRRSACAGSAVYQDLHLPLRGFRRPLVQRIRETVSDRIVQHAGARVKEMSTKSSTMRAALRQEADFLPSRA